MGCSPPASSVHGFPRQEYWSGLPFPSPQDLPDPGIERTSPAWQVGSLPLSHQGRPEVWLPRSKQVAVKKTCSNQRSSTTHYQCLKRIEVQGFPSGSVVKNLPVNAGDAGLIPGLGRSRREGNGNLLQYSCLENPTDREAW